MDTSSAMLHWLRHSSLQQMETFRDVTHWLGFMGAAVSVGWFRKLHILTKAQAVDRLLFARHCPSL